MRNQVSSARKQLGRALFIHRARQSSGVIPVVNIERRGLLIPSIHTRGNEENKDDMSSESKSIPGSSH